MVACTLSIRHGVCARVTASLLVPFPTVAPLSHGWASTMVLEAEVQVNDPAVIMAAEGRSVVVVVVSRRGPIAVPVLAVISAVLMPTVVPAAIRTLVTTVSLMFAVVATVVPLVTMP